MQTTKLLNISRVNIPTYFIFKLLYFKPFDLIWIKEVKKRILNCTEQKNTIHWSIVCLFGFYGISTFVGYLMLNPFLYK